MKKKQTIDQKWTTSFKNVILPNQPDSHQSSPSAMIVFLPFLQKETKYSLSKFNETKKLAKATSTGKVTVVSDILSLSISSSKHDPVGSAEVTLASGDLNYVGEVIPGDHALIWIFNNAKDFDRIGNAVLANQQANDFNSGLKFIGRVSSVRENLNVDASGVKTLRYTVTFKSFSEFQSHLYYNPYLKNHYKDDFSRLANISDAWQNLITNKYMKASDAVLFIINAFLGTGPKSSHTTPSGILASPNRSFMIPSLLPKLLGLTKRKSAQQNIYYQYTDLLYVIIGLQKYRQGGWWPDRAFPKGQDEINSKQIILSPNIKGELLALPDVFSNNPIWDAIQQYSNSTINETYCTLRPNFNKDIFPTLTIRQIPFTTQYFVKQYKKADAANQSVTLFSELPRWVIDPKYPILNYNFGNSEALRFNFCQTYVQIPPPANASANEVVDLQIALGNYDIDLLDIHRNGSRNHITTSLAKLDKDGLSGINEWAKMIGDWHINGHLKMNGTITLGGVQPPICVGDNVEINNRIFHIEGINHQYSVSERGLKSFLTVLQVANGMMSDGTYIPPATGKRAEASRTIHDPGWSDTERHVNVDIVSAKPANTHKPKK